MYKVGYHGTAQDKRNENEKSIRRMIEMFQIELEEANDSELAALAACTLEAGANYSQAVRRMRQTPAPEEA